MLWLILFLTLKVFVLWSVSRMMRFESPGALVPSGARVEFGGSDVLREQLLEVAQRLDLSVETRGLSTSVHGWHRGSKIRLEAVGVDPDPLVRLIIRPLDPAYPAVTIRRRGEATVASGDEAPFHVTGDPEFDRTFSCQGTLGLVLAVLDATARGVLLELTGPVEISSRGLTYVADLQASEDAPADLVDLAGRLTSWAERASQHARQPYEQLAKTALADPQSCVRADALRILAESPAPGSLVKEAAQVAVHDPEPEVRLAAAGALPGGGQSVLLELAAEESTKEELRAGALLLLEQRGHHEDHRPPLFPLLEPHHPVWVRINACAVLLGVADPRVVDALIDLLSQATDGALYQTLRLVEKRGDSRSARAVWRAWRRSQRHEGPALKALSTVGDLDTLGRLHRHRTMLSSANPDLDRALEALRERLQVAPGGLAIVEDDAAGGVSVSPHEPGALSVRQANDSRGS